MPQAGRRGQDGLRWLLGSGTSGRSYLVKRISQAKPRHTFFPSCARLASSAKRASRFTRCASRGTENQAGLATRSRVWWIERNKAR